MNLIHRFAGLILLLLCLGGCSCRQPQKDAADTRNRTFAALQDSVSALIHNAPGQIGIALISSEGDTLAINDHPDYPMMSVFKLHQALAVAHMLRNTEAGLDTLLNIRRTELDLHTWSPMLNDYATGDISLPVRDLIAYMLLVSDNNASNILFDRIVTPAKTDSILRSMVVNKQFSIRWREADMHRDNVRSYDNVTSPLAAAELMYRVFNDSLLRAGDQQFICEQMGRTSLTNNRIGGAFDEDSGVKFAHKSGSGYVTPEGVLIACNDVAYVRLPSGLNYALAVLIRDFMGTEESASALIANISKVIYKSLSATEN